MMKGGVEVLTRYLAKELALRGIAANTVAPSAIETDIAGGSVRDDKQVNDFITSVTALGARRGGGRHRPGCRLAAHRR
jgi:NAD(P)-dependent dehydrogenase (short-subunit alcohol dehydrogenase family)